MDGSSATVRPGLIGRLRGLLTDSSETSVTNRLAGTIVIIRVVSAGLAYLAQILLARWMGGSEYGIYVYVWTWVLLLGTIMDFGTAAAAQKLIPEYRGLKQINLLRGFLFGSRWLTFGVSTIVAALLAALIHGLSPWLDPKLAGPLYIGCAILPGIVLANMQDGISRSHDWMRLALTPQYIVRQSLIIGFTAGAFALGANVSAEQAMKFSAGAVWIATIGQMIFLNRRLQTAVDSGPRNYDFKRWLKISLPILMVEGFFVLLTYVDVLILQYYRPSDEVGIYHAVVKTLALVSFIHYAMSATTAHRFSEYHVAGDRERLSAYLSHSIKWTFWPSVAATALLLLCGKPLLWLFGPQFTAGYPVMFVLAIGLIARSAIGPVERLLNMVGLQNICAMAYALAFAINLVLCILLVPYYGLYGAAASTSIAMVSESILLFFITRQRLGFHVFAIGSGKTKS